MPAITKLLDRFTETDIDEEIIIMRLDTGDLLSLAGTGATVWRLIDGERDRRSLFAALADDFPGDDQRIALDVGAFLAELKESGLIDEA